MQICVRFKFCVRLKCNFLEFFPNIEILKESKMEIVMENYFPFIYASQFFPS